MALTKIDDRGLKTPIDLIDNEKIRLGTHNDLEIYHDGNNSFLEETGTGGLYFRSSTVGFRDIANNNDVWIDMNSNAGVDLYYNGIKTFATEDNGAYIYGPEGGIAQLMLYADEGDDNPDKWRMAASASASQFNLYNFNDGGWETSIECNGSGNVELYYDGSKKLETDSNGVNITGQLDLTSNLSILDNSKITIGSSDDLQIYHDGTSSYINDTGTGHLNIKTNGTDISFTKSPHEQLAKFITDGACELYYDNVKTFETTGGGAIIRGTEGGDANLFFYADEGDDNADQWRVQAHSDGSFKVLNYADGANEINIEAHGSGNVELYYDNSKKLETTSVGAKVTGRLILDGGYLHVSGSDLYIDDSRKAYFGNSSDLQIFHDGSHSYIKDTGTGELRLASNQFTVQNAASNETLLYAVENGAVGLKYDDSLKLETTSAGVSFSGDTFMPDNESAHYGTGNDMYIYHDGSNSWITNTTGNLIIKDTTDTVYIQAPSIRFQDDTTNEDIAKFISDGAVELYYNNNLSFKTETNGVQVLGTEGNDANLYIFPDEADDNADQWRIRGSYASQNLRIESRNASGTYEQNISCYGDGAVELYYDASKKFSTYSGGTNIPDGQAYTAGDSYDVQLYHHSGHGYLTNNTGTYYIRSNVIAIQNNGGDHDYITIANEAGVSLYYDDNKKFETTSGGVSVTGALLPAANDTYDLGSSSYAWNNLYVNDLHFSNNPNNPNSVDGTWGDWTLQEGENDIFMLNNRTGKKYKMALQEVV